MMDKSMAILDENQLKQLPEVALVVILYGLYLWLGVGAIANKFCDAWFHSFRLYIARRKVLTKLCTIPEDACRNGPAWRVLPLMFSLHMAVVMTVLLFEGNVKKAANLCLTNLAYTWIAWRGTYRQIHIMARVSFVHQFLTNWVEGTYTNGMLAGRPVILRCIASILFFDHTDEAFLHMLIFAWAIGRNLGWDSPPALMPLRLFAVFLLPVRLSGIREWICSQETLASNSAESKRKIFSAFAVPLMTMLLASSRAMESLQQTTPQHHLTFLKFFGLINVLLFIVWHYLSCELSAKTIPESLLKNSAFIPEVSTDVLTSAESVVRPQAKDEEDDEDTEDEDSKKPTKRGVLGQQHVLTMNVTLTDIIFVLTAGLGIIHFSSSFIAALVGPLILSGIAFRLRKHLICSFKTWKSFVFYCHASVVALVCWYGEQTPRTRVVLIALMTIRMLFVFEKRSFLRMQRKLALLSIITSFLCKDDSLVLIIFFLSLCVVFASLVVQQSRSESAQILARENNCQAFLSHAVKQKFSGVANAVENILTDLEAASSVNLESSSMELLEGILNECRRGQRACHGLSITRNLFLGKPRPPFQKDDLVEMLELKHKEQVIAVERLVFRCNTHSLMIEADFELLEIFLARWASGSSVLEIRVHDLPEEMTEIRFKRSGNRGANFQDTSKAAVSAIALISNHPSNTLFLKQLNGGFVPLNDPHQNECAIVAKRLNRPKLPPSLQWITTSSTPSPTIPISRLSPAVPPNLSFAILDDNLLVRKNVERVVFKHFYGDKSRSFTSGASFEDCILFPQRIIDRQVNIAIFDENLEFDQRYLRGTDLARKAKEKGFKGCMILHSADSEMDQKQPRDSPFHGFICKTTSQQEFIQGIIRGWESYNRSLKFKPQQKQ